MQDGTAASTGDWREAKDVPQDHSSSSMSLRLPIIMFSCVASFGSHRIMVTISLTWCVDRRQMSALIAPDAASAPVARAGLEYLLSSSREASAASRRGPRNLNCSGRSKALAS